MNVLRHAAGLAVFMTVGLAACGSTPDTTPTGVLPPDGTVAAEFRTDRTQYTMGSTAKLTMVNRSTQRFTMGVCDDVLERAVDGGWVEIPPPNTACIALALLIAPGDSATLSFDLKQATNVGAYRIRRRFLVERGVGETTYLRSNTFTMVR